MADNKQAKGQGAKAPASSKNKQQSAKQTTKKKNDKE